MRISLITLLAVVLIGCGYTAPDVDLAKNMGEAYHNMKDWVGTSSNKARRHLSDRGINSKNLVEKISKTDDYIGVSANKTRKHMYERGIRSMRYGDGDTTRKVDQNGEEIEKNRSRIEILEQLLDILQIDLSEITKEFITIIEVTEVTEVTEVIDSESIDTLSEAIILMQLQIDLLSEGQPTLEDIEGLSGAISSIEESVDTLMDVVCFNKKGKLKKRCENR